MITYDGNDTDGGGSGKLLRIDVVMSFLEQRVFLTSKSTALLTSRH